MMSRAFVRCSLLALAALPLAACGSLADQLQAKNFAVGALLSTPETKDPKSSTTIPALTTFQLYFGQIDESKISLDPSGKQVAADGAFTGVSGAVVKLTFHDAGSNQDVELTADDLSNSPNGSPGEYFLDSKTAQKLVYDQTTYTATISYSGQTYTMQVAAPPPVDIQEFENAQDRVITGHSAGAPLTLTRSVEKGSQNPIAFWNLSSQAQAELDTNAPKDPLGFLQLVLDDSAWRADTFAVPGSDFQPSSGYVVTFASLAEGSVTSSGSSSLFVGSTLLAGAATWGGVTTD